MIQVFCLLCKPAFKVVYDYVVIVCLDCNCMCTSVCIHKYTHCIYIYFHMCTIYNIHV